MIMIFKLSGLESGKLAKIIHFQNNLRLKLFSFLQVADHKHSKYRFYSGNLGQQKENYPSSF